MPPRSEPATQNLRQLWSCYTMKITLLAPVIVALALISGNWMFQAWVYDDLILINVIGRSDALPESRILDGTVVTDPLEFP